MALPYIPTSMQPGRLQSTIDDLSADYVVEESVKTVQPKALIIESPCAGTLKLSPEHSKQRTYTMT